MADPLSSVRPRTNWAGNIRYSTDQVFYPETLEELCEVVVTSSKLRVLGSRHCFNTIADSPVAQVSLEKMKRAISLDDRNRTVTVEAGMRYGDLCPWLHEKGYALHNLASLPHISIAGACATATHGSGMENGNLATAVSGLEMVLADGTVLSLSRGNDENFPAAVVALGALGVVSKLTLDIEPTYTIKQEVFLDLPVASLLEHFEAILTSAYSVSLFTDYGPDRVNQVWVKQRLDRSAPDLDLTALSARPAVRDVHPIPGADAVNCTRQMRLAGPWHERLPHFRMGFTPSSGEELQVEYFVPREDGPAAYQALQTIADSIAPLLLVSEIRAIAEDDLWLSMCYQRPSIAFHFTLMPDLPSVERLLPNIERTLAPFATRPHWGKLFAVSPDALSDSYEKLPDFRDLARELDPGGKFRNRFVEETILS